MNKMKKLLALALCLAMVLALAACGGAGTDIVGTSSTPAPTEAAEGGVLTDDEAIYMAALGDFYEVYQEALAAETLSERWALMAVAEAKFLESGVASPMYTAGGCYAMSRNAFRSGGYISWMGDRVYYDQMILTNEVIGNEDYAALTDLWYELAGTGTYSDSAREYLAGKGYTFADTAVTTFDRVGTTWDILSDGDFHDDASFIDYLYQYDSESVQQPRLLGGLLPAPQLRALQPRLQLMRPRQQTRPLTLLHFFLSFSGAPRGAQPFTTYQLRLLGLRFAVEALGLRHAQAAGGEGLGVERLPGEGGQQPGLVELLHRPHVGREVGLDHRQRLLGLDAGAQADRRVAQPPADRPVREHQAALLAEGRLVQLGPAGDLGLQGLAAGVLRVQRRGVAVADGLELGVHLGQRAPARGVAEGQLAHQPLDVLEGLRRGVGGLLHGYSFLGSL